MAVLNSILSRQKQSPVWSEWMKFQLVYEKTQRNISIFSLRTHNAFPIAYFSGQLKWKLDDSFRRAAFQYSFCLNVAVEFLDWSSIWLRFDACVDDFHSDHFVNCFHIFKVIFRRNAILLVLFSSTTLLFDTFKRSKKFRKPRQVYDETVNFEWFSYMKLFLCTIYSAFDFSSALKCTSSWTG